MMSIARYIGSIGLNISAIDDLATLAPRNRTLPTGGVHKPIHKFITIMMPKCNGDMPSSVTTGKKMGVKIKTAGVISIKIPTSSKITLIVSRMSTGLSLKVLSESLIAWGHFASDNIQDIADEAAINSITMAMVSADLVRICGHPLSDTSR